MRMEPFGHLDAGTDLSGTAAQRGDGLVVLGLLIIVVIVIALMGSIASDKRKVLKTGDKAPRTGEYRAEARAFHGEGRTIAPPAGERWRLEEAHITEQWLLVVLLLCGLGVLCYSQINIPRAEETVGHALGVAPPQPTREPDSIRQRDHRPSDLPRWTPTRSPHHRRPSPSPRP
jgi:hypothetical protein